MANCLTCIHQEVCKERMEIFNLPNIACQYEAHELVGEWVWKEYDPDYNCGDIVCSKCNIVIYEGVPQERRKFVTWDFCPNCGADMRK